MDTPYYFSKWMFFLLTLFILSISTGIIYFSLLFYPDAWQLSLLFAIPPLLIILFILPEYIRALYLLFTKKPALILTKEKLIDNFNGKEYKWSEISKIEYKENEGIRAYGGYTAVYLNDSNTGRIPDAMLEGKKSDLLETLIDFHNKYKNQ